MGDPSEWPSWWRGVLADADPELRDKRYFQPGEKASGLAEPFDREGIPMPSKDDEPSAGVERPDPATAYVVGQLLWSPPNDSRLGPLTESHGRPPRWWHPADAARRIRSRLGTPEPTCHLSVMTMAELAAALQASIDKARQEKENQL
ncbi:MAG TPA: hypothetical protein VLL25_20290 [Acidimicrobiales bacterium]|nr:hypothetical protein [Acidimicrobiales bacterium]